MFVAILSSTIVANALPTIIADLHGSQTGYTWVVTATLLATTATTPIWGKLADLFEQEAAGPDRHRDLHRRFGRRRPGRLDRAA